MTEKNYSKRELDNFFQKHEEDHSRLEGKIDAGFGQVNARLDITNGKVKKIIIALVAVMFFVLGLAGREALPTIIKLLV